MTEISQRRTTLVDPIKTIDEYIDQTDWRTKDNSNKEFSLSGMVMTTQGKLTANYWLDEVYSEEAGEAHRNGTIHIHDLDVLGGYCAGWSLRQLLETGFRGAPGRVESTPPRHMRSAVGQIVNFLCSLQGEWAGAQAFSSFDTLMAPFVRLDNLSYEEVEQNMQEMVFSLNVPSRTGGQSPFTNLTFDWTVPEDMKYLNPIIGGEECDFTYGDLTEEMEMVNKAFITVMMQGDDSGRPFSFPIPTYNITKDFDWNSENANLLFEMTAKYGLPYFQNFINSDMDPEDVRSMCCRLRLDLRELRTRGNGLFGSGEKTGSVGVVTINMARLGYKHKGDVVGLQKELDELLVLAKDSLEAKRVFVNRLMDEGLYPYSKFYLGHLNSHFSTIGVNGMNEMIRNFTNDVENITTEFGHDLAYGLLEFIRNRMSDFQEETGNLYNLEATPGEGACHRFALRDIERFPDIIQAGTPENNYYTNSSQAPVNYTEDLFEVLANQDDLQRLYTGGTVLHVYQNAVFSTPEVAKAVVKKIFETHQLPYITLSPVYSICPTHGFISGTHEECPECGETCEVFSRVMGYYRPVRSWNTGKKGEFAERTYFKEPVVA